MMTVTSFPLVHQCIDAVSILEYTPSYDRFNSVLCGGFIDLWI